MKKSVRTAIASLAFCTVAVPAVSQSAECTFPVVAKDYRTTVMADKEADGKVVLSMTVVSSQAGSPDIGALGTYAGQYSTRDKTASATFATAGVTARFPQGTPANSFVKVANPSAPVGNDASTLQLLATLKNSVEGVAKCSLPAAAFAKK